MASASPSRYRIVDTIGRGGMGEVCLADDLVLDRKVALKFLQTPTARDALDHLLAEARAAAALDHPFICSIYDISTLDGRPCIAMEYVRGETLERRLRRGPLPPADALRVAEEIAEALEAAHKRRVVHRDLKPANVMLTEDQHIKVMDFGLAMRLPAAHEETAAPDVGRYGMDTIVGTPAYMAPEQIRGEATDRRSDIFAFGTLLYQLLSGANPFLRTGVDATLAAILGETPASLHDVVTGIPPGVSAVVARLLAKDPAERYQTFADVRRDLRRLSASVSSQALSPALAVATRVPRDGSVRLIGREAERAQLLQAIGDAAAGRGTLIVLAGEAGIGKTRLAEEALDAGRRRGLQTLVGRCSEQEGTPPLVPYIELLEAASRVMPAAVFRQAIGASAPELARLLPELVRLMPDMPAPLELPPALRQRYLFTNLRDFLARASQAAPLMILLDDLQSADESTLQMTLHLAAHLPALPLVVIAALRDVEPAPAVAKGAFQQLVDRVRGQSRDSPAAAAAKAVVSQLASQGQARVVTLRPLTESDVRGMLAGLARREPPPRIVREFLEHTGGNPYFVSELFRHLQEDGRLFDPAGMWRRDLTLGEIEMPDSVRTVMERRLQRVSREAQDVLRAAAVIGPRFDLDLLERVAGVDEDTLLAALEEAEGARLLKGPSGRQDVTWRFTHHLICQTLTHGMPTLRRQRLHLRIADAMEQLDASSRMYTSELAHHLYSAGRLANAERTARALVTAGNAAHDMYAAEEAVRHYRRALDVIGDSSDDATRRVVEERLADLLALVGDRAAAMQHYQRVGATHEAAGRAVDRARLVRKIGTLHWQAGHRAEAMACYERARQTLDESDAHIETAHLYQELGLAAFRSGDNAHAIEWGERALREAEAALADPAPQDPDARKAATIAIAQATNTIGVALARSGKLDAARDCIERSVALARELGLLDVACRAYANLGVLYSTVEPKRAIEVSLTGLELASRIGAASMQSFIYANLAAAYCALTDGCETEGLQAARAAAELDRQLGQLDHLAVPLIVLAQIHQCRGELDEAQRHYSEALAIAEQAAEPQLIVPCYDGLATIALDKGDRLRAEEYMTRSRDLCDRAGLDPDTLLLLPFLS